MTEILTKCNTCLAENSAESNYCNHCGNKLDKLVNMSLEQWRKENPKQPLNNYFQEFGTGLKFLNTKTEPAYIASPVNPDRQPYTTNYTYNHQTVILENKKSVFLSVLLTFILGPLGLIYSSVTGAILMILIDIAAFISFTGSLFSLSVLDESFAAIGLISGLVWLVLIQWPVCILWGIVSSVRRNNKIQNLASTIY